MAEAPAYKSTAVIEPFKAPDVQQYAGSISSRLSSFAGETAITIKKDIIESEKSQAAVTLRDNYSRIREDVLDNPGLNMQKEFDTRWGAFSKGYLETVSGASQSYVQNQSAYYGLQGNSLTGDKVRNIKTNIRQENFNEYYKTASTDISNQAFDGTHAFDKSGKVILDDKGKPIPLAAKTMGQLDNKIDFRVQTGDISGKEGAALKVAARDTAVKESFTGQFDRILKTGDKEERKPFLEKFQESADLDRHNKDILTLKFKKMMKEYDIKDGVSKASIRDELSGLEAGFRSGTISPESSEVIQTLEKATSAGIDVGHWENKFQTAESAHYIEQDMRDANRAERLEMISEFDAKEGDSPEILYRKSVLRPGAIKIDEDLTRRYNENPVGYMQDSKAFIDTLEQRDVAATDENGNKVPGSSETSIYPFDVLEHLQLRMGSTNGIPTAGHSAVRIMDSDIAADEANRINSLPIEQQAQAYNETIKQFPGREHIAAKDLERAGVDPKAITVSNLYNDPRTLRYAVPMTIARVTPPEVYKSALEAFKIPDKGASSLDGKIASHKRFKSYNNAVSNYNGNAADAIKDIADNSKLLASQLTVTSQGDAKRSVDDAVNAFTNGLTFTSYRGKEFFHPDDISTDRLKTAYRAKEAEIMSGKLNVFIPPETLSSLTPDERQRAGTELVVGSSFWQSNPDKTSAVMVDSHSSPIKDLDGNVVEILFDDMRKDNSDINKSINQQYAKEQTEFFERLKLPTKPASNFLQDNLTRIMKSVPDFMDYAEHH